MAGSRRTASLKRIVDPKYKTTDGQALTDEQRRELTLKRIAKQRSFEFMTLDGQTLSKRRALAEVRNQTPLGRTLVDIEHQTIALMCEWIWCQPASVDASERAGLLPAAAEPFDAFRACLEASAPGTPAAKARKRSASDVSSTRRLGAKNNPKRRRTRRS